MLLGILGFISFLSLCSFFKTSTPAPPSRVSSITNVFYSTGFRVSFCPIWISVAPLLIASLCLFFISSCLSGTFLLALSAPYPAEAGFRLEPSSVSCKVALQPAACLTRALSLQGRATHTSVPLLPRLWHSGSATALQLLDQH